MQCNFHLNEVTVGVNRALAEVPPAELFGVGSLDRLECAKAAKAKLRCSGSVTGGVRARIPFRVAPRVCRNPAVRVSVHGFGGVDCDPGQACPGIGFFFDAKRLVRC